MSVTISRVRGRGDTVLVPMNQVRCCRWGPNLRFLATEGLNGCTAVAIYSQHGGVLAHIAPRTANTTGDQNVLSAVIDVVALL